MEVINRRHKDIQKGIRQSVVPYVKVDKRQFYFSAACNIKLGIIGGLYMHFINDNDKWQFYINNDEDGFLIFAKKGKLAVGVSSSALVNIFLKRTKCSMGNKFPIQSTEAKMNDCVLYEIMINKVME